MGHKEESTDCTHQSDGADASHRKVLIQLQSINPQAWSKFCLVPYRMSNHKTQCHPEVFMSINED